MGFVSDKLNYNIDKNILEYARKKGTIVHKEIQNYLESHLEGVTSEFYEFLRLYTEEQEKFVKKAIFDFKTYSVATPKNREKCYKQIKMYAKGVKYLTGIDIDNYYMVHLPHNKKGKIYGVSFRASEYLRKFRRYADPLRKPPEPLSLLLLQHPHRRVYDHHGAALCDRRHIDHRLLPDFCQA